MKILVTGGAGYIGSHTVVELFKTGHEPIILDNFSNSQKWIVDNVNKITNTKIKVYEGDCRDIEFVNELCKKEKNIDGIIHFAAFKAVYESIGEPLKYYNNNVNSLLVMLEAMKENNIKNIVFSSSATVYGEPDENPLIETAPLKKATNPYGTTKLMAENIIEDFIKGNDSYNAIALRYFNPIGAHSSHLIGELPIGTPSNLIPYITQTAIGIRDRLTIFGNNYDTADGTCIRDFIHVVDLAKAHIATLEHLNIQKSPYYDVFNVGTGRGVSVMELVSEFEKINKFKLQYEFGQKREGDVEACWADAKKIKKLMGWEAKKNITDALYDSWEWEKYLKGRNDNT